MSDFILGFLVCAVPVGLFAAFFDWKTTEGQINYAETDLDKKRQITNIMILQVLTDYAAKNPSQRFGQILRNTGLVQDVLVQERGMEDWESGNAYISRDLLFEEPYTILKRMKETLEEQNRQ